MKKCFIKRKSLLIAIALICFSCSAFGQEIKSKNAELEDLLTLLKSAGYELFSFDISDMLEEQYNITLTCKEYNKEGEIESNNLYSVQNKRIFTDFAALAEKITFGFYPAKNDSTVFLQIDIPNISTLIRPINLKGLPKKDSDEKSYSYSTRPFEISVFEENKFIPLVLYGSMWWDEKYQTYRFCGESEINPDMSTEILKNIPHYYVFGITFTRKE